MDRDTQEDAMEITAAADALERQADAILARDDALLADLKRHADALQNCYQELMQPRNDPEYIKALEAHEATRNDIANGVLTIHLVPEQGKSWISIGLSNPRNHAKALDIARKLGDHFEAKVIRHEDPFDQTRLADRTQAQPRRDAFGREKRSNPE